LSQKQTHQIRNVLRMRPGDHIEVLDNEGWEYEVSLDYVGKTHVSGKVVAKRVVANEPGVRITLFQSLVKRERFEWILQKGSEMGVSRIVPVFTQRALPQEKKGITPGKISRWKRIITEAAEQSGRGRIPELRSAISYTEAIDRFDENQLALIPWEEASEPDLRTVLAERLGVSQKPDSIAVFIGPEGGFALEEIKYARDRGLIPITLGPRILRTETAAVVAIALILYELGELT